MDLARFCAKPAEHTQMLGRKRIVSFPPVTLSEEIISSFPTVGLKRARSLLEFSQNNNESMLVMRDENSQNFYFFIGDKLWKWYKAFDSAVFPAGGFANFAGAVQNRFGEAKEVHGALRPGDDERHWLEWQDKTSRLRAVDQTAFYGFYCLVFEEKDTVNNLARLRTAAPAEEQSRHALVDSVTGERSVDADDAPNIADRITGKLRQVEQAPEDSDASGGKRGKTKRAAPASTSTGVSSDDDPLRGL